MNQILSAASVKPVSSPRPGSRKLRLPLLLRAIRWAFPKVESMAPRVADAWFVKLFFTPVRFRMQPVEQVLLQQAGRFTIRAGGQFVEAYSWGEGPAVLFVHGWAGRGPQFHAFIRAFVAAGFRAIAFDAPAHGLSKGKQTSLVDFKDAIQALHKKEGAFSAIVAHSLGGAATLFALTEGVFAEKLITISTPASDEEILHEFASRIGASPAHEAYLRAYVERRLGRQFHHLMAPHFAGALPMPIDWLILHDEQDKEASVKNTELLLKAYPRARAVLTSGLGHIRILRDDGVVSQCLAFVKGV